LQTAQVSDVAHRDIAALARRDALCDPAAIDRSMSKQDITRPVFIPVIIGTPPQGRLTEPAANFVFGEVSKRSDIETKQSTSGKFQFEWMMLAKRQRTASSQRPSPIV